MRGPVVVSRAAQRRNRDWWQARPMTYDWHRTLQPKADSVAWFAEVDRRFLDTAYYAKGPDGTPFGRFIPSQAVSGNQVLEIGCGMGTVAALLSRAGATLTAIDLTTRATATTKRRLELAGYRRGVSQADAETLPFMDGTFDMVWSWGVIHHSCSTTRCLAEIARVLKPGGTVCLMVYHTHSIVRYLHCGLFRGVLQGQFVRRSLDEIFEAESDGAYARHFNHREWRRLLERSFDSLRLENVGQKAELVPLPAGRVKSWLVRLIPDGLASGLLRHGGSMLVARGVRR